MAKKYNLSSKSDMNRFMKDLEQQVKSNAEQQIMARNYDVECPHCHSKISTRPGAGTCPVCHNTINLDLNIKYK
jgi:Zn finger protein HypA/HybF involved in hydrogenase expression